MQDLRQIITPYQGVTTNFPKRRNRELIEQISELIEQ